MHLPCIVLEEIDLLSFRYCSSQVLQELAVGLCGEGIIDLFHSEYFMTAADCSAYGLARLVSCSVLHSDILLWIAPGHHLHPPGTEN